VRHFFSALQPKAGGIVAIRNIVTYRNNTQSQNPENHILNIHRYVNLKSLIAKP